jgi:hypothetical protein
MGAEATAVATVARSANVAAAAMAPWMITVLSGALSRSAARLKVA